MNKSSTFDRLLIKDEYIPTEKITPFLSRKKKLSHYLYLEIKSIEINSLKRMYEKTF
jgi:hypothetical protein